MEDENIIIRRQGVIGRLTLNRPRALNALTQSMCETILRALSDWERDPSVAAIIVDAVPGRAFCVGGDIRAVYELGRAGDPRAMEFFATEYRLNAVIARYPKPYISLLNGIVMGGGAGISVHGKFRVATEHTLFAMPETAIGFIPDVGGSFFLSRCPGKIGLYLGLTGSRIGAPDTLYAGLATHYVSSTEIEILISRLASGEKPETVLDALGSDAGIGELVANREAIDRVFGACSVKKILTGLIAEGAWGTETAALLRLRSPTSLHLVLRQLIVGASQDLEHCLAMELAMVGKILKGHDFYEGVRAVLVDKDQNPQWLPERIEDVDAKAIAAHFDH